MKKTITILLGMVVLTTSSMQANENTIAKDALVFKPALTEIQSKGYDVEVISVAKHNKENFCLISQKDNTGPVEERVSGMTLLKKDSQNKIEIVAVDFVFETKEFKNLPEDVRQQIASDYVSREVKKGRKEVDVNALGDSRDLRTAYEKAKIPVIKTDSTIVK
jgi:hypothetical protein